MVYLIELLQNGNVGGSKELAERLDISQRTVKRKLNTCRELGYKVKYNRKNQTYEITNME